jgi:hypothetical protein
LQLPAALVIAATELVRLFVENVVREFGNVFMFLDRILKNAEKGFQMFFKSFEGLANIFNDIGKMFKDFGSIFEQLIGAFRKLGENLDVTKGGGVIGDVFRGDTKAIGKRLGFATGLTEVPPGFPRDSFPANLTSGERVIDADANRDLKDFLAQARTGGSRDPIVVVLQVGQEELARTIVQLDRNGFQLRA